MGGKKSPPQYIENIDFLIGSNPIDAVLQAWNNTTKSPMNFIRHPVGSLTLNQNTLDMSFDSHFYYVLAVTMEVENAGTFNDYGSADFGMISWATLRDTGPVYAINDTFTVNGGTVL